MKTLLAICMFLSVAGSWAGETPPSSTPVAAAVKGEVLEVREVESYTYLRLETRDGETWAAVNKSAVTKGSEVTIQNVMVMHNFESKTLKKTFKTIIFGTLGAAGAGAAGDDVAAAHAGLDRPADIGDFHVPKATGANARTVAEINAKRTELKDQPVLIRGKVVKYNPEIMGKNWIHLRDGSGTAAGMTNDILVTTQDQAKVGDIVTAKGVVRADKDFGAGYAYKVLIEDATLKP
jgi:hypothetical protein